MLIILIIITSTGFTYIKQNECEAAQLNNSKSLELALGVIIVQTYRHIYLQTSKIFVRT